MPGRRFAYLLAAMNMLSYGHTNMDTIVVFCAKVRQGARSEMAAEPRIKFFALACSACILCAKLSKIFQPFSAEITAKSLYRDLNLTVAIFRG